LPIWHGWVKQIAVKMKKSYLWPVSSQNIDYKSNNTLNLHFRISSKSKDIHRTVFQNTYRLRFGLCGWSVGTLGHGKGSSKSPTGQGSNDEGSIVFISYNNDYWLLSVVCEDTNHGWGRIENRRSGSVFVFFSQALPQAWTRRS